MLAFRDFARGVMRRRLVPSGDYQVAQGAQVAWIRNDASVVFLIDGRPHNTAKDHEVTCRLTDEGGIELSWTDGTESHGTSIWHLEEAGNILVVSDTIHDPHFKAPVEYSTSYRRAK